MTEHGICAKCKKSVGCSYADDRITGCKKFVLEPELELANEEWLRQCTTEQLAEWIADKINDTVYSMSIDAWAGDVDRDEYWQRKSEWIEWLKQPHME